MTGRSIMKSPSRFPIFLLSCLFMAELAAQSGSSAPVYRWTTLAGRSGIGSEDGPAADARFNQPRGLARDSFGVLYVADTGNHTIRRIGADGVVTTLAGRAGVAGSADGAGATA